MSEEQSELGLVPRKWGWRSLVGVWGAYWAGLAAVTLGPFGVYVWKLARIPGNHGNVSLSLGDNGIKLTALRDGATAWSGSVALGTFALWVAGPPLAVWLLWLLLRPARSDAGTLRAPAAGGAIGQGAPEEWPRRDTRDASRFTTMNLHERDR